MAPQFAYFQRNHRVVSVDLRGHGQSEKPEQDYLIAGFADDLIWLCCELGIYKPTLIGHGMGGLIVLDFAVRYPDVPAAIVLMDAPIPPLVRTEILLQTVTQGLRTPAYREVLRQFIESNFQPVDDPEHKTHILGQTASIPQHVLVSTWDGMLAWDSTAAIAACRVPVLYIGAGTPNADLIHYHDLCPHIIIGTTVGSGHFHGLEVPEQVNAMIDRFLALPLQPVTGQTGVASQIVR